MSERLNILSIDWDFFMKTTDEDFCMFPDGGNENIPLSIQSIIWSNHYAERNPINGKKLKDINVDTKEVEFVKKVLEKQVDPVCMITDSHKHIYNFIQENMDYMGCDAMNLVNLDFHHDIYNNSEDGDVNCGNWLRNIITEYRDTESIFTWVNRENSDVYDMEWVGNRLSQTKDISIIGEYDWDVIFICRSGMWSPPHLDKKFIDTFQWMLDFYNVTYQNNIFEDRMPEVDKVVTATKQALSNVG